MAVRIRPYEPVDVLPLLDLAVRAWEPVFRSLKAELGPTVFLRLHPDWRLDQRAAVEATLADPVMTAWVAESETELAGFTAARLHVERGIGEISMLAVEPIFQSQGIGSRLTGVALEWIAARGMAVAMVETGGDPGHAPARRTYEKAGFGPLGVVRYFMAL